MKMGTTIPPQPNVCQSTVASAEVSCPWLGERRLSTRMAVKKMRPMPAMSIFCARLRLKLMDEEREERRFAGARLERRFRDVPPLVLCFFFAIAQMFPEGIIAWNGFGGRCGGRWTVIRKQYSVISN